MLAYVLNYDRGSRIATVIPVADIQNRSSTDAKGRKFYGSGIDFNPARSLCMRSTLPLVSGEVYSFVPNKMGFVGNMLVHGELDYKDRSPLS